MDDLDDCGEPGRTFDLVVEDSPSHELGPSDAFKEITRYLETIIQ